MDDFAYGGPSGGAASIADVDHHGAPTKEERPTGPLWDSFKSENGLLDGGVGVDEEVLLTILDEFDLELLEHGVQAGDHGFATGNKVVESERLGDVGVVILHHGVDVSREKGRTDGVAGFYDGLAVGFFRSVPSRDREEKKSESEAGKARDAVRESLVAGDQRMLSL